jgi:hypothetical protein
MSLSKNESHLVETVNGLRDEMVDFTMRLVAQDSTLGNEKGALGVMEDRLTSLRLSYFPGTSFETICSRINSTLNEAAAGDPWLSQWPPKIEYYGFRSDGHGVSRDVPALSALNDCHRTLTGEDAVEYIATCTTDLRAFHFFGNAQATCYGPEAKNIHGANESVAMDRWCRLTWITMERRGFRIP